MEYLRIKSLFAILSHYGIGIIRSENCEELDSMIYDSNDMGWLPSKASSFNEDDKIGIMYFDKTDEYVSHFTFEGADKNGFVRSINPIYEDYYIQLGFTFEEIKNIFNITDGDSNKVIFAPSCGNPSYSTIISEKLSYVYYRIDGIFKIKSNGKCYQSGETGNKLKGLIKEKLNIDCDLLNPQYTLAFMALRTLSRQRRITSDEAHKLKIMSTMIDIKKTIINMSNGIIPKKSELDTIDNIYNMGKLGIINKML